MLSDDSDELRNNGYYSPIPSPVAGARSPQNDDVIHGSSSFERRAELADINNRDYSSTDESAALIKDKNTRVYLRRWYVLFVFSLGCAVTGFSFGQYGPIAQSLEKAFGWSDNTIAMLGMWNNLGFVLMAWPFGRLLEMKGLRFATIVSMLLVTFSLGLRCASSDPVTAKWLNNISQVLAGTASIITYSSCALLSALWFPVHQRTTATAIGTFMGYLGIALSFIIGPLVVPDPGFAGNNTSGNATDGSDERDAIMVYFYSVAGISAFVLLLTFIYFPAKPPLPPTISAGVKRLSQGEGVRNLLKNVQFHLILFIFGFGAGIYQAFSQILDIDLDVLDVSQTTAGWMGFYSIIGGCLLGFITSWISDMFTRKLKLFLLMMFMPATAMLVWFLLLIKKYIATDMPSLYITVIVPGCFIYGSQPLFYELACETAYPTGEDVAPFMLNTAQNLVATVILGILIVPGSSVSWINWVVTVSIALGLVLLLLVKEDYNRMKVDDMEVDVPKPDGDAS
ncbi:hypothetical protein RRG08_024996 [Elysia crispata]|uniref:Major facilitator superfamily (MFS) profile domain-containing protein n=1 Tax=Elysia crispata TaxID=231223 RepID=A0AAE1BGL1_9GAST|nr:hypothetical protein RRG08_024996 [Elysia crispata]